MADDWFDPADFAEAFARQEVELQNEKERKLNEKKQKLAEAEARIQEWKDTYKAEFNKAAAEAAAQGGTCFRVPTGNLRVADFQCVIPSGYLAYNTGTTKYFGVEAMKGARRNKMTGELMLPSDCTCYGKGYCLAYCNPYK